eukprot:gene7283-399_t
MPSFNSAPDEVTSHPYDSDEFRMYSFKVVPCSKHFCHDWTTCPFAHPKEKARRRDVRGLSYYGIACADMTKNLKCPRGDGCSCAHNVFEYWLHPSRYRTQMCNEGPKCKRKTCFFAHSSDELRITNVASAKSDAKFELDPFSSKRDVSSSSSGSLVKLPQHTLHTPRRTSLPTPVLRAANALRDPPARSKVHCQQIANNAGAPQPLGPALQLDQGDSAQLSALSAMSFVAPPLRPQMQMDQDSPSQRSAPSATSFSATPLGPKVQMAQDSPSLPSAPSAMSFSASPLGPQVQMDQDSPSQRSARPGMSFSASLLGSQVQMDNDSPSQRSAPSAMSFSASPLCSQVQMDQGSLTQQSAPSAMSFSASPLGPQVQMDQDIPSQLSALSAMSFLASPLGP